MRLSWPAPARLKQVRGIADARPFAPGDLLLLRQKLDRSAPPILTRPLKAGGRIDSHNGVILHDDLISRRVRDVVCTAPSRSGKLATEYRLHEVKLEEYVKLSRRLVTPIYPSDARLIVELLDLHVQPSDANDGTKLEILEAGTGHGALTLYLSRAIHAANPPLPAFHTEEDPESIETVLAEWKLRRRAILHTLDTSSKYSAHAAKVVEGFKRGMYYHNVDFHVSDVGAWLQTQLLNRGNGAFLSHAILDMPSAEAHLSLAAQALRTDGCLVIFNPSITQIMECYKKIREDGILLEPESVIELGVNGGSGGREWNVRAVKPRAKMQDNLPALSLDGEEGPITSEELDVDDKNDATTTPGAQAVEHWSMICRPKVGDRIVGGGFLGVFRKQRDMLSPSE